VYFLFVVFGLSLALNDIFEMSEERYSLFVQKVPLIANQPTK